MGGGHASVCGGGGGRQNGVYVHTSRSTEQITTGVPIEEVRVCSDEF